MYLVPLMLGVKIVRRPAIVGITEFSIRGVVLTVDWGGGGGPKVSMKSHDPLIVNGMVGIGSMEDIGGTGAIGINNRPNKLLIRGL